MEYKWLPGLCNFLSPCPSLRPSEAERIMQAKHIFVGLLSWCKYALLYEWKRGFEVTLHWTEFIFIVYTALWVGHPYSQFRKCIFPNLHCDDGIQTQIFYLESHLSCTLHSAVDKRCCSPRSSKFFLSSQTFLANMPEPELIQELTFCILRVCSEIHSLPPTYWMPLDVFLNLNFYCATVPLEGQ